MYLAKTLHSKPLQGVLDRVARHSAQAAAGVLSVADKVPARVADTLVRRLGGRATLVGPKLAADNGLQAESCSRHRDLMRDSVNNALAQLFGLMCCTVFFCMCSICALQYGCSGMLSLAGCASLTMRRCSNVYP